MIWLVMLPKLRDGIEILETSPMLLSVSSTPARRSLATSSCSFMVASWFFSSVIVFLASAKPFTSITAI